MKLSAMVWCLTRNCRATAASTFTGSSLSCVRQVNTWEERGGEERGGEGRGGEGRRGVGRITEGRRGEGRGGGGS